MELLVIIIGGIYLHWAFGGYARESNLLFHDLVMFIGLILLLMAIGASIVHLWF